MRPLGWAINKTWRSWMSTLRTVEYLDDVGVDPRRGSQGHIFCVWHETVLFLGHYFRDCGMQVMISRSTDGELVTNAVERLGYTAVRGSTGRGGLRAVRELVRDFPVPSLVMTPDGPRGPRRQVQIGAVYLASRLQVPLVAAGCGLDRPWRLNSWDKLAVPRPFTRAVVCGSKAIHVPPDADQEMLEQYRQRIEAEMHAMTERAERLLESPKAALESAGAALSVKELKKSA
jgi:lysophospholipid acyltransferase (LPLAT)-like uncharacterized protein